MSQKGKVKLPISALDCLVMNHISFRTDYALELFSIFTRGPSFLQTQHVSVR